MQGVLIVVLALAAVGVLALPPKGECKKKPEGNPLQCCAHPKIDKKAFHDCIMNSPENFSECVFDGKQIVKDNAIDRDELVSVLETAYAGVNEGFTKEFHERVVDACIDKIKNFEDKMKEELEVKEGTEGKKGRGKLVVLAFCLKKLYFKDCPASAWTTSDSCTAWKKFAEDCPIMAHRGKPE